MSCIKQEVKNFPLRDAATGLSDRILSRNVLADYSFQVAAIISSCDKSSFEKLMVVVCETW